MFGRAGILPNTVEDTDRQPLETVQGCECGCGTWKPFRDNADNVCRVSWVLRNITDPKAIDPIIRPTGTIRWFNGNPDHDLPYNSIGSAFEACFDSTKQLYPGMRDRVYFLARAIFQMSTGARAQSYEHVSKYFIPTISSGLFQHTDPDLHRVTRMLEHNTGTRRSTLNFPEGRTNTHAHLLWMSNLFVELAHKDPDLTLESYGSYLSPAVTDHQPAIANIFLSWCVFLGGRIREETFWTVGKPYAVVLLSLISYMPGIRWKPSSLTCRQE